uniref:Uncharacterized protein n=1 Tax=Arundo donax TaxID=35708 RepID=A0A0A9I0P0_ARUDO
MDFHIESICNVLIIHLLF